MNDHRHMMRLPNPYIVTTVSVEDAAPYLGVGRAGAYLGVKNGDIPSIKVGGRRRVPVAAIYEALGLPLPPPPNDASGSDVAS